MSMRHLASTSARTAAIAVVLLTTGLAAQKATKPWTTSRTPWGDPDLQGVFTNSNEYATPLERPDRFAGKRLSDITSEELAEIRRTAQQQAIAGLPGGR